MYTNNDVNNNTRTTYELRVRSNTVEIAVFIHYHRKSAKKPCRSKTDPT